MGTLIMAESQSNGVYFPHHVLLDLTSPMNNDLAEKCVEAIENVLVWADFTQEKMSLVGVSCITSTVWHVLKPTPLKGNFSAVCSSSRVLLSKLSCPDGVPVPASQFKDLLVLAVTNAVRQLEEDSALKRGPVITVLSCRGGQLVAGCLQGLHAELTRHIDGFQVVELSREHGAQPVFSVYGGHPAGPTGPVVRLAVVPVGGAVVATLERTLRAAWFTPRYEELLPLQLLLGLGGPRGRGAGVASAMSLRCVASACLVDTARLPVADLFTLVAAAGIMAPDSGGTTAKCSRPPTRVVRVVSRVAADGVCEGSLFGLPLRVTWAPPTAALQREEYRQNAHLFLALCESLSDEDEYLVARIENSSGPAGTGGSAGGHFILMPGDDCLLVRAIASAELLLPPPPPPPLLYDGLEAARAALQIRSALDAVPTADQYQAKHFPSGLCAALRLNACFPRRLCLGRQRLGLGLHPQQPPKAVEEVAENPPSAVHRTEEPALPPQPGPFFMAEVVDILSSDDDEDVPEVNVRRVLPASTAGPAKAGTGRGAVAGTRSTASSTASSSAPVVHKLGTGGHPALQDDFAGPPAKRSKKLPQPLFTQFKAPRRR